MLSCACRQPILPPPARNGGERPAQLVGLGRILRVVDDDVIAVRPLQRVLDGARLGARLAVGHDEHAHVGVEIGAAERRLRLVIGPLDDEHDFEPVGRIVEGAQRNQQVGHDARLAEQRDENRIERQRRVGPARRQAQRRESDGAAATRPPSAA